MAGESKRQSSWIIVGVILAGIALFFAINLLGGKLSRPRGDASSTHATAQAPHAPGGAVAG